MRRRNAPSRSCMSRSSADAAWPSTRRVRSQPVPAGAAEDSVAGVAVAEVAAVEAAIADASLAGKIEALRRCPNEEKIFHSHRHCE